ncbi:MAG: radical SAM protein [Patescibacteria group bacterium]
MAEETWEERRKRILRALRAERIKLLGRRVRQPGPLKPKIEDLVGGIEGKSAVGRWYHLPYQEPKILVCPPVSLGCQVSQWGRERGWPGGCRFCLVGKARFGRPLSAKEITSFVGMILDNASCSSSFWRGEDRRFVLSFTSAGEPFLNYDAVIGAARFLKKIFGSDLFITIITSGILEGVRRLTEEDSDLGIQLRLSVHFPSDRKRQRFMPMQDHLNEVLRACIGYAKKTGIALVLNWALIKGMNDGPEHAESLARLLQGNEKHVLVRISRLNPYGSDELQPSSRRRQKEFIALLRRAGIPVVRAWRGFATLACATRHFEP